MNNTRSLDVIYSIFIMSCQQKDSLMKFNIIGAGRLGKNLALSLSTHNHQLLAICNRTFLSATSAVEALNLGQAVENIADLPAAGLILITSPDDQIEAIAIELASNGFILPGCIIAHCSGVLASDILKPLQDIGCFIASIHPLKAFRADHVEHDAFHECHCVVEGDKEAVMFLNQYFSEMGAHIIPIAASNKSAYHAAAVMASNYLVTLAHCSIELLKNIGIDETDARAMIYPLMQGSLNNLNQTDSPAQALTGPLARGDIKTIERHLEIIHTPQIDALYRAAGLATLPMIQQAKTVLLSLSEKLLAKIGA